LTHRGPIKKGILAPQGDWPDRPLDDVGVELDPALLQEQRQSLPVAQGVADRLGQAGAPRDPRQLGSEPRVQGFHQRPATLLPDRTPLLGRAAADLRLDGIELADPAQRLFRQRRAGRLVDLE
jgi:hypothetical protein